MTEQKLIPPGIYFDLPEDEYHADPALGSTALKALAVDPVEYQWERLHGEDKDTEAMTFGSAVHARLLEGVDSLNAKFYRAFNAESYPDALRKSDEIKKFIKDKGASPGTRVKAELVKQALELDPAVQIIDALEQTYNDSHAGKQLLPTKRWEQIEVAAQWAQKDPLLSKVMENGTFKDGAPEVAIFYVDRGIRLKARMDRLLRHAIVDIKTYAPLFSGPVDSAVVKTIDRMKYHFQPAAYLRAWNAGKELFAAGHVFGKEPVPNFLRDCFNRKEPKWIWIMIKSKGAPQPLVIDWVASMARGADMLRIEMALDRYLNLCEKHGIDNDWPPEYPALTLSDSDLPSWFGM